nr:TonB-dependent receptor [Ningiella sp. W23]
MQDSIKFNETDWSLVAGIRYDYYALEAKKMRYTLTPSLTILPSLRFHQSWV